MVSSPSEITPLTATFSWSSCCLTSRSSAVRSPCVLRSLGRANRISSERQSRTTQSTSWPTSGCKPGSRQDDVSLLLQACLDALLIRDAQGHQFFIALHQIGHTALRNTNATCLKRLMHLRHTAMFPEAPLTNQRNHLQAKFAVWQRPASFLLWSVGLMEARTTWLNTLTHNQGQSPQTRQHGDRAMAVMGHP